MLDSNRMSRTLEDIRNATLKVDQSRILVHAVLLGHRKVLGLDERDAVSVAVIVDVLQFLEDLRALFTVIGIFMRNGKSNN